MKDLQCVLSGMLWLLGPPLLMILRHKKTGARFYPAIIAFPVCIPVFFLGGAIRSVFSTEDFAGYYIRQGILYGILEEGAKFLVLRFHLTNYDSRKDAVSYGIGHAAFEAFGSGMTCLGLTGTGRAAPDLLLHTVWAVPAHIAWTVSLTVLIFYGIYTDKWKRLLPIAMLLHAAGNMVQGIFMESAAAVIYILLTAGQCFAAYRCWQTMGQWEPAAWNADFNTDE